MAAIVCCLSNGFRDYTRAFLSMSTRTIFLKEYCAAKWFFIFYFMTFVILTFIIVRYFPCRWRIFFFSLYTIAYIYQIFIAMLLFLCWLMSYSLSPFLHSPHRCSDQFYVFLPMTFYIIEFRLPVRFLHSPQLIYPTCWFLIKWKAFQTISTLLR